MAKPRPNLDRPRIPKATAAATVPFAEPSRETARPTGGAKSLTVKLTLDDYWALRDFCTKQERQTGRRVTHQDAMVMGLHCLLQSAA